MVARGWLLYGGGTGPADSGGPFDMGFMVQNKSVNSIRVAYHRWWVFTVPAGVRKIEYVIRGQAGKRDVGDEWAGRPGQQYGILLVTPGESLALHAGSVSVTNGLPPNRAEIVRWDGTYPTPRTPAAFPLSYWILEDAPYWEAPYRVAVAGAGGGRGASSAGPPHPEGGFGAGYGDGGDGEDGTGSNGGGGGTLTEGGAAGHTSTTQSGPGEWTFGCPAAIFPSSGPGGCGFYGGGAGRSNNPDSGGGGGGSGWYDDTKCTAVQSVEGVDITTEVVRTPNDIDIGDGVVYLLWGGDTPPLRHVQRHDQRYARAVQRRSRQGSIRRGNNSYF